MRIFGERYEILDKLGDGGYGEVYRVRDRNLGAEFALKLLRDSRAAALVIREAHSLKALASPHILQVSNAGVDIPYIATELAPMGSTEDQVVEGIGVPPELAVRWVRHALVGLAYCHQMNIIHRDVTPANIFLDSHDRARLGDFGVAENMDADGTASPAGNQRCRAPEGYGGRLTAKSDLFSMGVTLWRLLTGFWPYEAATEAELAALMRGERRPRLRDVAPNVHRSIAQEVERALDPTPDCRPSSADEMEHLLAGTKTHPKNWVRYPSGSGHTEYRSTGSGSPLTVTIVSDGHRRTVETRYQKSGNRRTVGCFETTASRLPIDLRRLFDRETQ